MYILLYIRYGFPSGSKLNGPILNRPDPHRHNLNDGCCLVSSHTEHPSRNNSGNFTSQASMRQRQEQEAYEQQRHRELENLRRGNSTHLPLMLPIQERIEKMTCLSCIPSKKPKKPLRVSCAVCTRAHRNFGMCHWT